MTTKRALIIFPDEWVNYSPSVLNSIEVLQQQGFEVELLSFAFDYFKVDKLQIKHTQITIPAKMYKLLSRLKWYEGFKLRALKTLLYWRRNNHYQVVLGIDNIGYLAGNSYFKHTIYFSLEVKKDIYFDACIAQNVQHCIIQSVERYNFLFDAVATKPTQLLVQNAPILPATFSVTNDQINARNKQLVYWGNIANFYGIEPVIDCLYQLPAEYTLTLRGIKNEAYNNFLTNKYSVLIAQKRLLFNYEYIAQSTILEVMKQYYIGFAMYDFNKLKSSDYNFVSSPSGKQFNYMAAGVPTIAQNIVGFNPIAINNAGVLLQDFNIDTILQAIVSIQNNYVYYAHNATKAAYQYNYSTCFAKAISVVNKENLK
jgi:hypothetical protein